MDVVVDVGVFADVILFVHGPVIVVAPIAAAVIAAAPIAAAVIAAAPIAVAPIAVTAIAAAAMTSVPASDARHIGKVSAMDIGRAFRTDAQADHAAFLSPGQQKLNQTGAAVQINLI